MTTAEVAAVVAMFALLITIGGIIYRAGGALARLESKITPLAEAKIPERLAVVERTLERHDDLLAAAFDVVPHNERH